MLKKLFLKIAGAMGKSRLAKWLERQPIHIIAIPKMFSNSESLLETVDKTLAEFQGKTVILLLSEGALGNALLSRTEGKKLAL